MDMAISKLKMAKQCIKSLQRKEATKDEANTLKELLKLLDEAESSINKVMNQIRLGEYQY